MSDFIGLISTTVYLLIGLAYFARKAERCEKEAPHIWEQAEILRPALKAMLYVLGAIIWPVMAALNVIDWLKEDNTDD